MQGGSRPLVPACWFPSVKESPSGEKTAPEQGFPTGFRTRCAFRRQNDAEDGAPHGIPYEMRLPAPK